MDEAADLNRTDQGTVPDDVTDEALEATASADRGPAMTWFCTNIWWCGPRG